jgi:hypothetical protein
LKTFVSSLVMSPSRHNHKTNDRLNISDEVNDIDNDYLIVLDIALMEAANRTRWPKAEPTPVDIAVASCLPSSRYVVPQTAQGIAPQDMLSTWETMRSIIFGGPGITVAGLSVKGTTGTGTGILRSKEQPTSSSSSNSVGVVGGGEDGEGGNEIVMRAKKEAPVNNDWLFRAIGGGAVVQQSVRV